VFELNRKWALGTSAERNARANRDVAKWHTQTGTERTSERALLELVRVEGRRNLVGRGAPPLRVDQRERRPSLIAAGAVERETGAKGSGLGLGTGAAMLAQ